MTAEGGSHQLLSVKEEDEERACKRPCPGLCLTGEAYSNKQQFLKALYGREGKLRVK